ncbi:hypothetical protein BDV12DRAFT_178697 [Aspergillus spectabilis]
MGCLMCFPAFPSFRSRADPFSRHTSSDRSGLPLVENKNDCVCCSVSLSTSPSGCVYRFRCVESMHPHQVRYVFPLTDVIYHLAGFQRFSACVTKYFLQRT